MLQIRPHATFIGFQSNFRSASILMRLRGIWRVGTTKVRATRAGGYGGGRNDLTVHTQSQLWQRYITAPMGD